MAEPRKTVFISCGQYTEEERELGKQVCEIVTNTTPFQGYFAENQTTLKTLSENVLSRLYESVGLIVIMHHRGRIEGRNITRASVWIEQEVAIATLMEQVLRRPLHVALFVQHGIAIEGIRQQIQLNPIEFAHSGEVTARLQEILQTWKEPLYKADEERRRLADSAILLIKTNIGHHRNYTIQVKNSSKFDMEINCICLWSKGQRISEPAFPPANVRWSVPAGVSGLPIQFDAGEEVAYRLWQLAGSPPVIVHSSPGHLPGHFNAEVRVVLRCDVLGLEREFEETRTVQVDFVNRQITGL
jgi:hypothetical protein